MHWGHLLGMPTIGLSTSLRKVILFINGFPVSSSFGCKPLAVAGAVQGVFVSETKRLVGMGKATVRFYAWVACHNK